MKQRPLVTSLFFSLLALLVAAQPAPTSAPAPTPEPAAVEAAAPAPAVSAVDQQIEQELTALIRRVNAKLSTGARTTAALAPELAEFDQLLAKHRDQKSDMVAMIVVMHAGLYIQVFEDFAKGRDLLLAMKRDFPDARPSRHVDAMVAELEGMAAAKARKAALIGSKAPELHFSWASRDGLKTLADLKGQVLVLDFWATWCGPCIESFPEVRQLAARFKDSPVAFVGVTSLQGTVVNLESSPIDTKDNPAKETSLLAAFMKKHEMTWTVAVSEEPVFNPAWNIESIPFLAIIAPDGTIRHAGLRPADPDADIDGKIEAILKEFKLPVPAK